MQIGLGLPQIHVTPHPLVAVVANIALLPAGRARHLLMMMRDEDMCLFGFHVKVNVTDVPGMLEAQQGGVDLGVGHDGGYVSDGTNPLEFR